MPSSVENVSGYFMSLIVGVILLYVLWEIVMVLAADIPQLNRYVIGIAIAAAVTLLAIVKGGISR